MSTLLSDTFTHIDKSFLLLDTNNDILDNDNDYDRDNVGSVVDVKNRGICYKVYTIALTWEAETSQKIQSFLKKIQKVYAPSLKLCILILNEIK